MNKKHVLKVFICTFLLSAFHQPINCPQSEGLNPSQKVKTDTSLTTVVLEEVKCWWSILLSSPVPTLPRILLGSLQFREDLNLDGLAYLIWSESFEFTLYLIWSESFEFTLQSLMDFLIRKNSLFIMGNDAKISQEVEKHFNANIKCTILFKMSQTTSMLTSTCNHGNQQNNIGLIRIHWPAVYQVQ